MSKTLTFKKGNKVKYGQDFRFWKGIPGGIVFEVSGSMDHLVLTAPGYGEKGNYGNGALHVMRDNFDENDLVSEEPKGEFNNTPNELGYVVHNGVRHDKNDGCPWCPEEPKQPKMDNKKQSNLNQEKLDKEQKACRCICHCVVKGDELAFLSHDEACEHCDSPQVLSKNNPELASNPDNTLKDIKSLNTWETRFRKQFGDLSKTPREISLAISIEVFIRKEISLAIQKERDKHDPLIETKRFLEGVQAGALKERESLKIGYLRQWLNEDRITDPKKMVTNEQIEAMLGISNKGVEEK